MQVRLLVKNDKANVKKVVLRSDTVIGRSSDCNLRIASQEVSRRHCSITLADDSVRVRDLGSSNGTFLNGQQLTPNVDVVLPSGAELSIGNVMFYIQHDAPVADDDTPSTAEVPNAAVAAAIVAKPVEPSPNDTPEPEADATEEPLEPDEPETAKVAALASPAEPKEDVEDTISGSASELETVNTNVADLEEEPQESEAPESDDAASEETIAFDYSGGALPIDADEEEDSDEPATDIHTESTIQTDVQAEAEKSVETVSMNVDELGLETPESEPESETEPEPAAEKKGFRKLFGLFGRKKQQPQEEDAEPDTDEEDLESDATVQLSAGDMGDEEAEEGYSGDEETLFEPAGASDEADEEEQDEVEELEEEPVGMLPEGEESPVEEPQEGDENLQDFFRNLAQD